MVTANVLQRTFHIAYGDSAGTGFTIDHEGKRYLVTAKHVVLGLKNGDELRISNAGHWRPCPVQLIGHAPDPVDISVLALPIPLSPSHSLPATSKGLAVSQDVYLAGFPYGLHSVVKKDINADYPVAFVKKGVISAFGSEDGYEVFYLDAHNNIGFSGGPVVFRPKPGAEFCVAGVISGYRFNEEPVYHGGAPTEMRIRENTGIVICWPSQNITKTIEAAPNGFPL